MVKDEGAFTIINPLFALQEVLMVVFVLVHIIRNSKGKEKMETEGNVPSDKHSSTSLL